MQRILPLLALLGAFIPAAAMAAFGFEDVAEKARDLASKPYQAPTPIPKFMQTMSYDDYQNIRFNPEKSLWRESGSRFQVMMVPPGLFYRHAVKLNVIDAEGSHGVPFRKTDFVFADSEVAKRVPANLGYAGFKLTYPLKGEKEQNQFMVFAGASYFRGVGRDNSFGISARGLAIDTGLSRGEEFPSFTEFWLERPSPDAQAMTFYGLLEGESVAGAYEFVVYPGKVTRLKVRSKLFPRQNIELLGVAPLTSMFYYGENTGRPRGEWRTQVHDSDGLQIQDGNSGEWLWRPLLNPRTLEMDYLMTENVRGFGLLQRDREFSDYQDLQARYELRPSSWVKTEGDWGPGQVVLVQLPTENETNDNIVAFWRPKDKVTAGQALEYAYEVQFGGAELGGNPMGRAVNSYVGDGSVIGGGSEKGAYRILVDFNGGVLDKQRPRAPVLSHVTATDGGEVLEHFVEYNEALKGWRLSVLARPAEKKPLSLRAYLSLGDETLTETWTYRLPANNDIRIPE
ncbi:glucan biosynthesis protein G [Marinobacterium aestuariivivens]|uniref:Glucans biosynthesis protein G n=1 Tax=Marinobacterium aestuariivivens TaxID=1698799 RepID=A0ABW2A447_9GAMM